MAAINTRMKILFVLATTVSLAISAQTDENPDTKESSTLLPLSYDNFKAKADKCNFPPPWMFLTREFEPCRNVLENDINVLCSLVFGVTNVICNNYETFASNIAKDVVEYGRVVSSTEQVCSDLKQVLAINNINVSNCTNACSSMGVVCEFIYISLKSVGTAENDKKKATIFDPNDKNGVPDNMTQLTTSKADADVNKTKELQGLGSQDGIVTNSNSLSENTGLNPNNPPEGKGSNTNNLQEETGSNQNNPSGGTGSNQNNLPGGIGSNTIIQPGGTGSNQNNPPGGTGSNTNDPPGGTGSNTNDPPGGTSSNTSDPPGGTGSNQNNLPGGTSSNTSDPPGGTGSNQNNPPGGKGSNTNDPPGATGSNQNNVPGGTGSNQNDMPGGTGSNQNDPPGGTGSNQNNPPGGTGSNTIIPLGGTGSSQNDPPGETSSNLNNLSGRTDSNTNNLPEGTDSSRNNLPGGTGSKTNILPEGRGSNQNNLPGQIGSNTKNLSGGDGNTEGNLQEGGNSNQGKTSTISSTETTSGNGINHQSNQEEQLTEGTKTNKKPTNTEEDNRQAETDQSVDKGVGSKENIYRNGDEDEIEIDGAPSSGNFMAYFLTAVVLCIAGYVVFHNKQKIFAFIIEGRSTRQRRRANGGGEYKKLQSNVEEVMPSLDKSTSARNFIY